MITIACCLWRDFPEPGWSEEYVRRLYHGVGRNLSLNFRFICFADRQFYVDGIEIRPLNAPIWKGNLPKTYVYSPEAGLKGRVLLFDLDNVIVGSIDDMAAYDGPFCVRGRLQVRQPRQPDGDMISFDADNVQHLWEKANDPNVLHHATLGREREFIAWAVPRCDQWQDVCPGHVVSYRHHCNRGLPRDARVVSCHGRPRPHDIKDSFIVENWK